MKSISMKASYLFFFLLFIATIGCNETENPKASKETKSSAQQVTKRAEKINDASKAIDTLQKAIETAQETRKEIQCGMEKFQNAHGTKEDGQDSTDRYKPRLVGDFLFISPFPNKNDSNFRPIPVMSLKDCSQRIVDPEFLKRLKSNK